MATNDVEVDIRFVCGVCLEPYGERQPKLLPCFHTFCLPCLRKLVTGREAGNIPPLQTSDTAGLDTDKEEGGSADSVTCPTCGRVIPLPPGGVAGFQPNFYLISGNREKDPQPVSCTLCDRDQTAQVHCSQCQNSFCSHCRPAHDRLCQGGQVRALQDPSDSSSSSSTAQKPSHCQVRQQLQMVEDAVKKLSEEEKKLNQEREAMDHSVNVRHATLLRHAGNARDACYCSLREAYDGLTERLHSSMAEARQAQDTLQQQLSPSQPAPVSTAQLRAALFLQGELQTILNRDLDSCSLLRHHMEDNPSLMTSLLHAFMGNIVKSSQASGPAHSQQPSEPLSVQDDRGSTASTEATTRSLNDLYEKFEDLAGRVTSLQSTNTLLSNANSKLATDHSSLQREVTTLKDNNATLTTQQAALQREVTAMGDKHAIVQQDLAVLTAEKDKACAQLTKLQTDLTSVHTDLTSVHTDTSGQQTDILQLKADHGDILAKLSTVQTEVAAALQKGDCSEVKADLAQVQGKVCDVEASHSRLQAEITAAKSQTDSLQQRAQLAQDALQANERALATLKSRFETANTQVAFRAWLSERVTTSKKQTLICGTTLSSVGGGYDNTTGVFTVPVTGTYLFLATTSPFQSDGEKTATLFIAVDGAPQAYTVSKGMGWSTAHTVVRLTVGEKVTLTTIDDKMLTFGKDCTYFTGALLQAEV